MPQTRSPLCYLVDSEPDTPRMMSVMLQEMEIATEQFDTVSAMLERYAVAAPDMIFVV